MYKSKFTPLQQDILKFLFIHAGKSFNGRNIAKNIGVSSTAVFKSLKELHRENLIKVQKDKESNTFSIELNRENPRVFYLKRIENIKSLYESGLIDFLSRKFPGTTLIVFGSYSFGEDTTNSDIDIAIIGSREKYTDLERFETDFERKISLHFYESFKKINKNLKENILNGIVMSGGIRL